MRMYLLGAVSYYVQYKPSQTSNTNQLLLVWLVLLVWLKGLCTCLPVFIRAYLLVRIKQAKQARQAMIGL
jgi:hypothetical protein